MKAFNSLNIYMHQFTSMLLIIELILIPLILFYVLHDTITLQLEKQVSFMNPSVHLCAFSALNHCFPLLGLLMLSRTGPQNSVGSIRTTTTTAFADAQSWQAFYFPVPAITLQIFL